MTQAQYIIHKIVKGRLAELTSAEISMVYLNPIVFADLVWLVDEECDRRGIPRGGFTKNNMEE